MSETKVSTWHESHDISNEFLLYNLASISLNKLMILLKTQGVTKDCLPEIKDVENKKKKELITRTFLTVRVADREQACHHVDLFNEMALKEAISVRATSLSRTVPIKDKSKKVLACNILSFGDGIKRKFCGIKIRFCKNHSKEMIFTLASKFGKVIKVEKNFLIEPKFEDNKSAEIWFSTKTERSRAFPHMEIIFPCSLLDIPE